MNPSPALQLHIEHVVLDGLELPPGQQARFTRAFVDELTRLLLEPGHRPIDELAHGGALASLVSPRLSGWSGTSPALLGRSLAATVHRTLFQVRTADSAPLIGHSGRVPASLPAPPRMPEAAESGAPSLVTPSV